MAGITTERPLLYHTLPDLSTPHPLFEQFRCFFLTAPPPQNLLYQPIVLPLL